jgi:hypothetical protein
MAILPSSEPDRNRTPPGVMPRHQTVEVCTAPLLFSAPIEIGLGTDDSELKVAAQYQSPLSSAHILMELS